MPTRDVRDLEPWEPGYIPPGGTGSTTTPPPAGSTTTTSSTTSTGSIRPPADQDWVWDNGVLRWGDWVWDTSTQLWKDPATGKFYDTSGNYLPDVGPDANKPLTARWEWEEVNKSIRPPADQDWVWDNENGILRWGDKTWDEQRQLWKDGAGKYYDTDGNPVSNVGNTPPGAKWSWIEEPSDPGTGNPWKAGPWNPGYNPDFIGLPPPTTPGGGGSGNAMPQMPGMGVWSTAPHLNISRSAEGQPTGQQEQFKPWGQPMGEVSQALRYGGPPTQTQTGGFGARAAGSQEWNQPGIVWDNQNNVLKWGDKTWDAAFGGWISPTTTAAATSAALRGTQ